MASHKAVIDNDNVYLVGGTSFSVPAPKFVNVINLSQNDVHFVDGPGVYIVYG